jgi:tetratricopeptide (TPR) repeat protein
MSLRTGVLAALLGACASAPATPTTGVVVDPEAPHVTPHGDLEILRHRAAIGLTADVRAELAPRLAAVGDRPGPDPGRDALRALAIELALVQGDTDAARVELDRLDRTIAGQGERASAELRALAATLRGAWLFDARRYADARSSHLRALVALDQRGPAPQPSADTLVGKGTALRALARDQLALGEAETAVNTLGKAIELHRDSPEAHIELHEDLLLAVDVMIAVKQPDEAVIVSSDAYNQALSKFGADTLPHAEALLMVGAATLAKGDRGAAGSVISDARAILDKLQAERSDPRFPISARALRRSDDLMQALVAASPPATTSI